MKNKKGTVHVPVLLREVLACFEGFVGKTVVDGTFGGGGHSNALISQGIGRVIGLDWDERVVAREAGAAKGVSGISGDFRGVEGILQVGLGQQVTVKGVRSGVPADYPQCIHKNPVHAGGQGQISEVDEDAFRLGDGVRLSGHVEYGGEGGGRDVAGADGEIQGGRLGAAGSWPAAGVRPEGWREDKDGPPAWVAQLPAGLSYRLGVALAEHTTLGVGGPADVWVEPATWEEVAVLMRGLPEGIPLTWVGRGSNLMVRDGGIAGVVAKLGKGCAEVRVEGEHLYAEAGATCGTVARVAREAVLGGLEFFAGIPGGIGGALCMNAGAYGSQTFDRVVRLWVMNEKGKRLEVSPDVAKPAYRSTHLPEGWMYVAAEWRLAADDKQAINDTMRQVNHSRLEAQPIGAMSSGSWFKNPIVDGEKRHAWQVVDEAGCRGLQVGGAQVSPKHANFFVNTGGATCADFEALSVEVERRVHAKLGIVLEREVRAVGRMDKASDLACAGTAATTVVSGSIGEPVEDGMPRLQVLHASYREMVPALKGIGVTEVDGVLLDLGLSSDQLDDPMRGLSYQVDGPLDMRLDSRVTFTAADILATWRENDLADLFWREADEPKSRKLAAVICAERRIKPIATTKDFLRIVERVYPPRFGLKRSHPAARLFQALRVQVNGERVALETVIPAAFGLLKPGGRLAIITFQANEDRMVKSAYRKIEEAHVGPRGERGVKVWKKGLPTAEEVAANPRAHSAKLRVLEKLAAK